jgi:CheY-like chemotaxis protein
MESPHSTPDLLNISALVIEDDHESSSLLQAILEPWGVRVMRTSSAEEAQVMLATLRPDIVLCDIDLPGADGLTFVRWLRASPDTRLHKIPAIAMTFRYEDVDARTARAAGFDVFLRKPIDPDQLPHVVALLVASRAGAPSPEAP